MWQRGKRLSWGEAKGVDSGTKGRWLPMIVNKRGVDVCWLVPASPAISFSLLLPHRASFRHVLPALTSTPKSPDQHPSGPSSPRKPCVKCQKSGSAHRPGIHQVSKSSERAAGKVGWTGARDKRKKAPARPRGSARESKAWGKLQTLAVVGSRLPYSTYLHLDFHLFHDKAKRTQQGNLLSGWSMCVFFSYIGQRDRDKDMSRRKADNLVKKVAVCLTHRDQSDGKNMIDIEINLYRTNFYAWCSFCLDVQIFASRGPHPQPICFSTSKWGGEPV